MGRKFVRLDPDLKESYRKEFDEVRDEYEREHLGHFEKIYPSDCSEHMAKYEVF